MKILKLMCMMVMLMVTSLTFFACDSGPLPEFSCVGNITISDIGLEGVSIKSSTREITSTDDNGHFAFTVNSKSLTIIPQKDGYMFEPAKMELKVGNNTANFNAIKIEKLTGSLVLTRLIITPTSILSYGDNHQFMKDGKASLKAKNVTISHDNQTFNIISGETYLKKHEQNILNVPSGIVVRCGELDSVGILINTYFLSYNEQRFTSDTDYINLYITKHQTNKDLKDNKIIYNMYGINNKSNTFTFDAAFVFEYVEG